MPPYHVPVLLMETVEGLRMKPGGIYVDATYGGGGHASEILNRLGTGKLVAFDLDEEALAGAPDDKRLLTVDANFSDMQEVLKKLGILRVNGIVADLGVSSHQINSPHRGFSYLTPEYSGLLDMRMGRGLNKLTAIAIVNTGTEEELRRIFSAYGELYNAREVAFHIVRERTVKKLRTSGDLLRALSPCTPKSGRNNFLSRVFQALRIEVNDELNALKALLTQSKNLLEQGSRIAVISYHSLEDRLVKRFFRFGNFDGVPAQDEFGQTHTPFEPVTVRPIRPTAGEVSRNPRARSAKLRIAQKR